MNECTREYMCMKYTHVCVYLYVRVCVSPGVCPLNRGRMLFIGLAYPCSESLGHAFGHTQVYGKSGTGKSRTMRGDSDSLGMIDLAAMDIFDQLQGRRVGTFQDIVAPW